MKSLKSTKAGTYTRRDVWAMAEKVYFEQVKICGGFIYPYARLFDRRRNFDKDVLSRVNELRRVRDFNGDCMRYRAKRAKRIRAAQNSEFVPVFATPIYRDYRDNINYLTGIHPDHLQFGSRRHWAKNDQDRRILSIIAKHNK